MLDAVDHPGQGLETSGDAGLQRSFHDPLAVVVKDLPFAGMDQERRQAGAVAKESRPCGQGNVLNKVAIEKKVGARRNPDRSTELVIEGIRENTLLSPKKAAPGMTEVGAIDYPNGHRRYRKSSGLIQLTMAEILRGGDITR